MKIGETLRELRQAKGWTQDQLADLAGTSAANISRIESDKHGVGSDLLNSLAYVFGYKVYQIIAMAEGYDPAESGSRFAPEEIGLIAKYRLMSKNQKNTFNDLANLIVKIEK